VNSRHTDHLSTYCYFTLMHACNASHLSLHAPPPTAYCPLSLHDALPISSTCAAPRLTAIWFVRRSSGQARCRRPAPAAAPPNEQIGRAHVELQSRENLVCRLLLEKKKTRQNEIQ